MPVKESDLRLGFTDVLKSPTAHEHEDEHALEHHIGEIDCGPTGGMEDGCGSPRVRRATEG